MSGATKPTIDQFLADLTLDQLRIAKDIAGSMIDQIESEATVELWVVQDCNKNRVYFPASDSHTAKEKLCEFIMSADFTALGVKPRMERWSFPRSEAEKLLEGAN